MCISSREPCWRLGDASVSKELKVFDLLRPKGMKAKERVVLFTNRLGITFLCEINYSNRRKTFQALKAY